MNKHNLEGFQRLKKKNKGFKDLWHIGRPFSKSERIILASSVNRHHAIFCSYYKCIIWLSCCLFRYCFSLWKTTL